MDPGTWVGMYIRLPGAGPIGIGGPPGAAGGVAIAEIAADELNVEEETTGALGALEEADMEDEERDTSAARELVDAV